MTTISIFSFFSHHIKTCHARILSIHDNKTSVFCEFSIIYCLVQKTKLLDKPIKLTIDVMHSKLVFFYYNNDGKKMLMIQCSRLFSINIDFFVYRAIEYFHDMDKNMLKERKVKEKP